MQTAKVFENGRSQAIRLPKDYRFSGDEVYVRKVGEVVMLFPKENVWETFINGLSGFSDDFFAAGRGEETLTKREIL